MKKEKSIEEMQVSRWELKGSKVQTQNAGIIVWTLDVAVVKRLRAYTSLIAVVSYFLSFLKCRVIMWTRRGADMLQWHTFAHHIAHKRHIHCTYKAHTLHHMVPPCSHGLCMCHDLHPLRIPLQSGPLSRNKNQNGPKRKQNPHPILPSNRVSFCLVPLSYSHGAPKPDLEAWAPLILHPTPSCLYQLWLPASWKWGYLGNFFWPGNSWMK